MKIKVSLALALLVVCTSVFAQDPAKHEMSADQKAQMEAMMKAMMPGDAHKLLGNMVGTFEAKVTAWMMPGTPPMNSTGTAVNSWIMGNRFVEQKFTGSFMGQPFNGLGYTGYDNIKKTYWSSWVDDMGTGVMNSVGMTADGGKTWKFTAMMPDPMTGKDAPVEEHITIADKDHHTFEMWSPGPDGKMMKMMEIAYTRK
jgi:uncharacterized protein DUF1579